MTFALLGELGNEARAGRTRAHAMSIGGEGAADEVLHMFRLLMASMTQTSAPLPSRPHTMHAGVDSNATY